MIEETIIAVFDTAEHAQEAMQDLLAAGVPAGAISHHVETDPVDAGSGREQGFWSRLFGGEPDHDTAVYDRSLASGSTVISVRVPDEHVTAVSDILERHNPIDIDERASTYGLPTGARHDVAAASSQAETLQLAEEQLVIGQRVVNRGTTRVRRFVVETPVEQQVTLHDETVIVDRHKVSDDRAVSGEAFTERAIEMTEVGEVAVVAKTARVREEVTLRKQVIDRVETVRDTVRREDVRIEHVPSDPTTDGRA
ncbi:YsnF/AvaK domain-containing protein [Lichenicoccus roseus]|uniref:DUF2382 domain-containing protein n=1 Tax=Lichenicoccus roseus TaxID=2683649 RepID=A0A5R9J741_9PROT|nr:YsnF/AvaK domain-containing protein [Lichenicoccus roseus]TLU71431.1 DUF2382 domain-containing protein [Lichenicoccus roseus]